MGAHFQESVAHARFLKITFLKITFLKMGRFQAHKIGFSLKSENGPISDFKNPGFRSHKTWPKGRFRPLKKFEKFEKFGIFSKLSNFPRSIMWKWTSTSRSVLVHFHVVESGKLESLEDTPLLLQPWWYSSPLPITARENKNRSAQFVQDQASLSPAATRTGFSSPPRPQICIAHGIRSVTLGHD